MIERVARAILISDGSDIITADDEWPNALAGWRETPEIYEDVTEAMRRARAAIAAMREPTEAMCDAGAQADMPGGRWGESTFRESTIDGADAAAAWAAMIDAALREGGEHG